MINSMITSEEIKRRLWNGAEELRGSMDASRYKDYMLGLMFYKFLSDKTLASFKQTFHSKASGSDLVVEYKENWQKYSENLKKAIQKVLGYCVLPDHLYQTWLADINSGIFELQKVTDSLLYFEKSVTLDDSTGDFKGLFSSSTIDFSDTALGSNLNERSRNVQALIKLFADLDMVALQEKDVLGDAYEYLIGQFALEAGKKAGEFYTPRQISEIMAQIVAKSAEINSIYDPAVGSGSLLLTVGKHLDPEARIMLNYYGQEKNNATYNLARMNLLLHGIRPERIFMKNGDTLGHDWPEDPEKPDEGVLFDAVVMNPPYSLKRWNRYNLTPNDPRFRITKGIMPQDSRGDYAFLLHGLFHLHQEGTMAIVLPHGVLFRGGAEGLIREQLVKRDMIDTVIGLPSKLFANTGIPVTIIILKKSRKSSDPILFIDASKEFTKASNQNALLEKDIARIVDAYVGREEIEGYSALVTRDELKDNEYNLNIPRYVSAFDEEIEHDVDAHLLGGIPKENIEALKVLNFMVPQLLSAAVEEIRPGYVSLTKSIDELNKEIFITEEIKSRERQALKQINDFKNKYWELLRNISEQAAIKPLKEKMLLEIKELLSSYKYVDMYDAYQVIAEIWQEFLYHDLELIADDNFYDVARTRVPNMVTKGSGSNKRFEQEGWIGAIVPNNLIEKHLFADVLEQLESLKNELANVESELDEIIEAAKTEGSDEYELLYDCIKKNKDDEPTNSFMAKLVKDELKQYEEDSDEYQLIKKVETLMSTLLNVNREVRKTESELNTQVQDKILELTEEEIDTLVYKKWFGDLDNEITKLLEAPIKEELDTLELLKERYESTLDDLEEEIKAQETEFYNLLTELVKV